MTKIKILISFLRNLVSLLICKEISDNSIELKDLKFSKILDFNLDEIGLFSVIGLCIICLMNIIALVFLIIFCIVQNNKFISKTFNTMTAL